tara:strand:+ start:694 stop:1284 length:591 start_codon:yes stop_codon:yes gene_type:complete
MSKKNKTEKYIQGSLLETVSLLKKISDSAKYISRIMEASNLIIDSINSNHCIYVAGNGGSAAHSQHFAAELVSRFNLDRNPLPAIALTTDSSILTAIANDYGYEKLFERQLEGLSKPGDVFIGLTTSGKSKNIIRAFKQAKSMDLLTIGICGDSGIKDFKPDVEISIPSLKTPLIQEMHGITIHLICDLVEKSIFS